MRYAESRGVWIAAALSSFAMFTVALTMFLLVLQWASTRAVHAPLPADNDRLAEAPSGGGVGFAPTVQPDGNAEPKAVVVSFLPNTRKINLRCGDQSYVGEARVSVSMLPVDTECVVTAVDSQRNRMTARVTIEANHEYVCFRNQQRVCE